MTQFDRPKPRPLLVMLFLCLFFRATPIIAGGTAQTDGPHTGHSAEADEVECAFAEEGEDIRILLTVQGAARIDFGTAEGGAGRICTVLIPTNAKEVDRLVRSVDGLLAASAITPLTQPKRAPRSIRVLLGSRRAGRTCYVCTSVTFRNHVLDGLMEEIEVVALLELAKAAHAYDEAERWTRHGDYIRAVGKYQQAIAAFHSWASSRLHRYNPATIFEPEAGVLKFKYVDSTNTTHVVGGDPNKVMGFPGITPKQAGEYLRNVWKDWTNGIAVSHDSGLSIVRVPENDASFWGLKTGAVSSVAGASLKEHRHGLRLPRAGNKHAGAHRRCWWPRSTFARSRVTSTRARIGDGRGTPANPGAMRIHAGLHPRPCHIIDKPPFPLPGKRRIVAHKPGKRLPRRSGADIRLNRIGRRDCTSETSMRNDRPGLSAHPTPRPPQRAARGDSMPCRPQYWKQ
jgi:hypothetical protein